MEFTCIKCEFKFNEMSYDSDERMCYECLYADDDEVHECKSWDVITAKDILDASAYTWNRDREHKIAKEKQTKEKSK